MKTKFTALPVGQGDAFLYQHPESTVLVDGGRSKIAISPMMQRFAPSVRSIDVLVCTHNDADHANGVIGILKSGIECKEVWLPDRWTYRLIDLLTSKREVVKELFNDWYIERKRLKKYKSLETYGNHLSKKWSSSDQIEERSTDLRTALEESGKSDHRIDDLSILLDYLPFATMPFDKANINILFEALEAAYRIREIATLAYDKGTRIRWFEYGTPTKKTHYQLMNPLNCYEVLSVKKGKLAGTINYNYKISFLTYVALSKANRESLVFYVAPDKDIPGVVFSADSDFSFEFNLPATGNYLITSPHHGSKANKKAYTKLSTFLNKNATVVRSDGNYRKRPGRSYLNLECNRYCTLCRGTNDPKQVVELYGDSGTWHSTSNTRSCKCV